MTIYPLPASIIRGRAFLFTSDKTLKVQDAALGKPWYFREYKYDQSFPFMLRLLSLLLFILLCTCGRAQNLPPVFKTTEIAGAHRSPMVKTYLTPKRI
ncbi:MAG: hypothetical protein AAGA31_02075, partial [Bacteroidota bacterium]